MSNIKIARKKPVDIKVIQITGTDENIEEIRDFFGRGAFRVDSPNNYSAGTLWGISFCHTGDWIAKGAEGQRYTIENSEFEDNYDVVS